MPSFDQYFPVITHPEMDGHHALLIDYIGSGCSDHSPIFDYSIENHARSVIAVLEYEGVEACTIIGYSMGGTVGIMLSRLRPDLVSNLIVAEANICPGGGEVTKHTTSYGETEYVNERHQIFLEELRLAAVKGDLAAALIYKAWSSAYPTGLYKSSRAIVELDDSFELQFKQLPIPRTFIFGERSLPEDRNQARPDAPFPGELAMFDIQIAVVPDSGHAMISDNIHGFVNVLKQAILLEEP